MGLLTILSSSSVPIYFTDRKRCKTITVLSPVPVRRKPEQWSYHPWGVFLIDHATRTCTTTGFRDLSKDHNMSVLWI